ncbi:DUF4395 domain-containing protein [Flavisolibacter tropicus]|uniref:DUF4395 domain-containing protein n=1 Tax=Flavisolibacter tropicus TaxID=1492898 RepID=A0A172TUV7_9BACT|nr:DUF4395 domain-containing protein [Flavisolibacter tropicus]ANE50782.1 hypothetical protein SY85_09985 [Flavisolibacter tropicus]
MKKGSKIIQFGEEVEGYAIPVLNEREIRAAAGILFLILFIALMLILFERNFLMVKYVIIVFLTDFAIRVFVSPRFSPVLIIGRLIVCRQAPEYVGAPQKKFAWKIGLTLSSLMFILLDILNSYSIFTGVTCFVCLLFLFFESAFGICLACLFYGLFHKVESLYCAGETCEVTKKQAIQKISWGQLLIVLVAIVFVLLAIVFLNDHFSVAPRNLKEIVGSLY